MSQGIQFTKVNDAHRHCTGFPHAAVNTCTQAMGARLWMQPQIHVHVKMASPRRELNLQQVERSTVITTQHYNEKNPNTVYMYMYMISV